jgi:hypothetical protein
MLDRVGKEAFVMLAAVVIGFLAAGPLGAAICGVLAVVLALILWTPLRGWLGIPPKQEPSTETGGRVGYRGRPGSYGNLKNATFGEKLDTAIENEGDVDASEADIK